MEIERLDKVATELEKTILNFPSGAKVKDDFLPAEEKIFKLRQFLRALNGKHLTLQTIMDLKIPSKNPKNLFKLFDILNENVSHYSINLKALTLCRQSTILEDIIFKQKGTEDIQTKVKICLENLFLLNDKLTSNIEEKNRLYKKQSDLLVKSYEAIHDYQDFLKKAEARRNQQLQAEAPEIKQMHERLLRTITKINLIQRLITNLIACSGPILSNDEEFTDFLAKYKQLFTIEKIREITLNEENASKS